MGHALRASGARRGVSLARPEAPELPRAPHLLARMSWGLYDSSATPAERVDDPV